MFFTFTATAVSERCNRLELVASALPSHSARHAHRAEASSEETRVAPETPTSADDVNVDASGPHATGAPLFHGLTLLELATLAVPGASVEALIERNRQRMRLSGGAASAHSELPPSAESARAMARGVEPDLAPLADVPRKGSA